MRDSQSRNPVIRLLVFLLFMFVGYFGAELLCRIFE